MRVNSTATVTDPSEPHMLVQSNTIGSYIGMVESRRVNLRSD